MSKTQRERLVWLLDRVALLSSLVAAAMYVTMFWSGR